MLYLVCVCTMITGVTLFHLQSSDDMKSKLKIQGFGQYSTHTVNSSGEIIYDNEPVYADPFGEASQILLGHISRPVYDSVGANYQVLLGTEQICW